jgi:colanic acid biosynthesis protein WcaH
MLDPISFKKVIENVPLVSIDLCLICDDHLLLGHRTNEPLKGEWFTPGGRIHKNETWQHAISRIIKSELNLSDIAIESFVLMGIWDHFYENSFVSPKISTHYVNIPHYIDYKYKPHIALDNQHDKFEWFNLRDVSSKEEFHPYMRNYADWILVNKENK